ncbi:hypothetical protein CANARDRAFT_26132 [[Candida] arabinofermentans NRRL YB-2248]|uniref:Squalene synthase n=1 Tax=[Candida] arabinofermentans NRRL YB-2248 TaxID=983967 RepID=A0A1E4T893_9ASCO|nr:hypothetical protein CANARDRAFT_26132 [[Candida] arabinofermentans NRRL YB-2248]
MGKVTQLLAHPTELKAALQLKFFRKSMYPIDVNSQSETEKTCYKLLKKTSRSFCAVIMELNPELRNAIMIFYLVLRALDTIEDDMTISPDVKVPILREFDSYLLTKDWTFNGSGPNEKDRIVLVQFDVILAEYHKLKPEYQDVIKDITFKMGNGMADYISNEEFNLNGVKTVADYDLYCHYVAGLVGEGLTKLTVAAEFGPASLIDDMHLSESMGLFLQKTNIIRDYKEDMDDGRSFWPEEIWSKHTEKLSNFTKPEYLQDGLNCTSDLVLNVLEHVKDVLIYLSQIYDNSTFNFCAIPQVMAIATLSAVFQNPLVFKQNVKIRKGETCKLILESRTYAGVLNIFSKYLKTIHHKCPVSDPNYLRIGIKCGELEQFLEELNPNPSHIPKGAKPMQTVYYLNAKKKLELDQSIVPILKKEYSTINTVLSLFGCSFIFFLIFAYDFAKNSAV